MSSRREINTETERISGSNFNNDSTTSVKRNSGAPCKGELRKSQNQHTNGGRFDAFDERHSIVSVPSLVKKWQLSGLNEIFRMAENNKCSDRTAAVSSSSPNKGGNSMINKTATHAPKSPGWPRVISAVLLLVIGFFFLLEQYRWNSSERSLPVVEFLSAINGGPPDILEPQSPEPIFLSLSGSFAKIFCCCG